MKPQNSILAGLGEQVEDGLYIIDKMPRVALIREAVAAGNDGDMIWVAQDHISHSRGSLASHYIMREDDDGEPLAATMIAHRARVAEWCGVPYVGPTYGSQARYMLRAMRWRFDAYDRTTLRDILTPWHYQHCKPQKGVKNVAMYDLTSAYWQLIQRMPSPVCVPQPRGRVQWIHTLTRRDIETWERVKAFINDPATPKTFRLIFVGAAASGAGPALHRVWMRNRATGKAEEVDNTIPGLSALAGAAALAVRCTYELVQMEVDRTGSRYANTDAVVIPAGTTPETWDRFGLAYTKKAEGDGDFRGVGMWQIGDKCTRTYDLRPMLANGVDMWYQQSPVLDSEGNPTKNSRGQWITQPGFRSPHREPVYHKWLSPRNWLEVMEKRNLRDLSRYHARNINIL